MTKRRSFLLVASVALAIVLTILLIKVGNVDLIVTLQQLKSVSFRAFANIVLLNALMVYLSTEKWRSIDAAWRSPSDSVPPRSTSYALTSVGLAMGTFLPVQLAMASARTLGTHVHGRALKRGTAGTLLEQGFDVYTISFLAIASAITWSRHGGARTWVFCASAAIASALLSVGPLVHILRWLTVHCKIPTTGPYSRISRNVWDLQRSGVLNTELACRLVTLSALRTGTVILMSIQTAEGVGLHIPVWQMAAAIPFVSVATIIAVTPGGIGLNDFAGAGALQIFGTPFATGAQWVLANRVLITASYFFVTICLAVTLGAVKMMGSIDRRDAKPRTSQ